MDKVGHYEYHGDKEEFVVDEDTDEPEPETEPKPATEPKRAKAKKDTE
jgi:hypothetical protein